jgi:hypothetical protein
MYSRSAFSKEEEEWGMEEGGRSSSGRPGKARARLQGSPEHQLPSSPVHGSHAVAASCRGRAWARAHTGERLSWARPACASGLEMGRRPRRKRFFLFIFPIKQHKVPNLN